jgi:hypothetical protein
MKTTRALVGIILAITAIMIVVTGCEGPPGPAGKDASFPFDLEGFAEGIDCGDCHNPDVDTTYFLTARRYQWERSKHAYGGDLERNGADCAGCHTTEGFIERAKRGSADPQTVTPKTSPSPPNCFSCHSPHGRGDFSLRSVAPVVIKSNISGVPDATFDYGKGNMCAWCHQTRDMSPKMPANPALTDTVRITSSRWYSHYGVQGQMLMGDGGYQFPASFLTYNYQGNSAHSSIAAIKQEGCAACHMAETAYPPDLGTGRAGGHTMNIRYTTTGTDTLFMLAGCNVSGCHSGANAITKNSLLAQERSLTDSLHALELLLQQRGWLTASGSINASSSNPLRITPAARAGALYNYLFIEHDLSRGIHNPKYAQDLANSSLQALRLP